MHEPTCCWRARRVMTAPARVAASIHSQGARVLSSRSHRTQPAVQTSMSLPQGVAREAPAYYALDTRLHVAMCRSRVTRRRGSPRQVNSPSRARHPFCSGSSGCLAPGLSGEERHVVPEHVGGGHPGKSHNRVRQRRRHTCARARPHGSRGNAACSAVGRERASAEMRGPRHHHRPLVQTYRRIDFGWKPRWTL